MEPVGVQCRQSWNSEATAVTAVEAVATETQSWGINPDAVAPENKSAGSGIDESHSQKKKKDVKSEKLIPERNGAVLPGLCKDTPVTF